MSSAVIVGAGIGGLAVALALQRRGLDGQVIERAGSPRELGFALALAPNALMALRELGVLGAVAAKSAEIRAFEVRRADGALLKRVTFGAQRTRSTVTLRSALHGAQLDAVGPEALHLGHEARGFTVTPSGAGVVLDNGHLR